MEKPRSTSSAGICNSPHPLLSVPSVRLTIQSSNRSKRGRKAAGALSHHRQTRRGRYGRRLRGPGQPSRTRGCAQGAAPRCSGGVRSQAAVRAGRRLRRHFTLPSMDSWPKRTHTRSSRRGNVSKKKRCAGIGIANDFFVNNGCQTFLCQRIANPNPGAVCHASHSGSLPLPSPFDSPSLLLFLSPQERKWPAKTAMRRKNFLC